MYTKNNRKNRLTIVMGPVLLLICVLFLPDVIFVNVTSKLAVGTVIWMAFWWVTGAVDYAITGLIPIGVNALFGMTDMTKVISNYSSETILLLLGASIIIASWIETGLDRRIAKSLYCVVGTNYRKQLMFWFILSVLLSAVLPNAVVCTTITPLAVTMLKYAGETDVANSEKASRLLLYIAYATGIGGLASPLGGAMNLVTIEYLQQITGEEYMYYSWVLRFLPFVVVLFAVVMLFMIRGVDKNINFKISDNINNNFEKKEKMSKEEITVLIIFCVAVLFAFTRKLYAEILPGLKPAYVFVICSVFCFFVMSDTGEKKIRWKQIQGKIEFEMIFIFAGGLAAGTLMNETGAVQQLGDAFTKANIRGGFFWIFLIILFTLVMSDVTSNTATAAVTMPIVIAISRGIGENPIPYIYAASIGVNLSFMLPTSIRAIPVGYGLKPKYMIKEGWKISLVVLVVMTIMAYVFMENWDMFLTV